MCAYLLAGRERKRERKSMKSKSLGLRKGAWTAEEDILLRKCIEKHGEGKWHQVPLKAGLNRCRKSCRLRWMNYLRPTIKRGDFTPDEVDLMIRLHKLLGNRWSLISGRLPGRTANDVKNYWNTNIHKKQMSSALSQKATDDHRLLININTNKTTTGVESGSNNNNNNSNIIKPLPRTFSMKSGILPSFFKPKLINATTQTMTGDHRLSSPAACDNDLLLKSNDPVLPMSPPEKLTAPPEMDHEDGGGTEWWKKLLLEIGTDHDDHHKGGGAFMSFYGSAENSGCNTACCSTDDIELSSLLAATQDLVVEEEENELVQNGWTDILELLNFE